MLTKVRVTYHDEGSSWWAESPDVDGYSAAADSLAELVRLVHEGLPFLMDDEVEIVDSLAQAQSWRVTSATTAQNQPPFDLSWGVGVSAGLPADLSAQLAQNDHLTAA